MQLRRADRTIQYDVSGQGAETVLFIPALGTTRAMWEPQVVAFQSEYTVVTYDPAGHDPGGMYDRQPGLVDYADDLLALVDTLGAPRLHLVGLSMGGMIAQEFAIRHPDRVRSAVLASTTSHYPDEARRQIEQRAAAAESRGLSSVVESRIEAWLTPDFRESHPDTVRWIRDMLESADPRAYAQAAKAVAGVDTTSRLPLIESPVLVLGGEWDLGTPIDVARALASHLPDAGFRVIAGASHLSNVEKPDEFNASVLQLIEQAK